jgi:hypothetical protein
MNFFNLLRKATYWHETERKCELQEKIAQSIKNEPEFINNPFELGVHPIFYCIYHKCTQIAKLISLQNNFNWFVVDNWQTQNNIFHGDPQKQKPIE